MKILVVFLFAHYVVCPSWSESNWNPGNWFKGNSESAVSRGLERPQNNEANFMKPNEMRMGSPGENMHPGEGLGPRTGQGMHQNPEMNRGVMGNGGQHESQPLNTNGASTAGQGPRTESMGPNGNAEQGPHAGSMTTGRSNGNAEENHGTQNSQRSGSGPANTHEAGNPEKPPPVKNVHEQQLDVLKDLSHQLQSPRPLTGLEKFANWANIGITFLFVPGAILSIYGAVQQKKESEKMEYYQQQSLKQLKEFYANQTRLAEEANAQQANLTKQFLSGGGGTSYGSNGGGYSVVGSPVAVGPTSGGSTLPPAPSAMPSNANSGQVDPFGGSNTVVTQPTVVSPPSAQPVSADGNSNRPDSSISF